MATSVTLNGVSYSIPATADDTWGDSVSSYLIAIASACLQKSGGSFTLTADADFGATYGLKSAFYKSRATVSTAGVLRLGNNESVGWRNAANSADKLLKVNASNVLEFDGSPIVTLALGTANYVLKMNSGGTAYEWGELANANIAAAAAIAVSKLAAVTASRALVSDASGFVSASAVTSTEVGYLTGVTAPTGSGALVLATSPTLVTPTLGVASATSVNKVAITAPATSATLTLADGKTLTVSNTLTFTGTDSSSVAFGAGGTVIYATNKLSALAATTSSELAGVISDETGSGALVFGTAPTIDAPNLTGGVTLQQISTPANPSSGYNKIYPKSDGLLYKLDSSGNEVLVGSGAGSGEINIVVNPNGDTALDGSRTDDVGDWVDSGTGTTSSRTTTTSEIPLYPTKTNAIKIVNDGSSTGYTYMRMTLPPALYSRKLKISWEQLVSTSTAYASGDFKVELYSNASSNYGGAYTAISLSTDSSSVSSIPAANGRFQTTFDASTAAYLELRITRVAGSASSYITLNDVVVGPGIQAQGAVVGPWTDYTISNPTEFTTSSKTAKWRRVGDSIEIRAGFVLNSAVSSTVLFSAAQLLPNSLTIGSLLAAATPESAGTWEAVDDSAAATADNFCGTVQLSSVGLAFVDGNGGDAIDATCPFTWASGDTFSFTVRVPIAEWAGSGTVNLAQNDVTFIADDGSSDVFGPNGALVPNQAATTSVTARNHTLSSGKQDTDLYILEVNYRGNGWTTASQIFPFSQGNNASSSNYYGIEGTWDSSSNFAVSFGNQGTRVSASNASAGASSWATEYAAGTRYRIRKIAGGNAVGFGLASSTSAGLVNPYSTNGVVYAGTYTPTLSSASNYTSTTPYAANYMRVGNVVFVTGRVSGTVTTTGNDTSFRLSLPVATANFGTTIDGTGVASHIRSASNVKESGVVESVNGTQTVVLTFEATGVGSGATSDVFYSYSYKIQ